MRDSLNKTKSVIFGILVILLIVFTLNIFNNNVVKDVPLFKKGQINEIVTKYIK
jgi:hypothetical protein